MKNEMFFQDFITNFYDGIEEEIVKIIKRGKLKKLNVKQYGIDGIDYKGNSKTPVIETIKYIPEEGLTFYYHNEEDIPEVYYSEEIFHTFSLAALVDAILEKDKYTKILQDFYKKSEEIIFNFLKGKSGEKIDLVDEDYEILGLGFENGNYKIVEGNCTELKIKEGRIYIKINEDDVHIAGINASDLACILNEVLNID
jgi:hypothetical protein